MQQEHQCKLCKHKWISKLDLPLACPKCKRYDWNTKKEETKDEYKNREASEPKGKSEGSEKGNQKDNPIRKLFHNGI